MDFLNDPRFVGIEPFESKVWLSSPTMHGEERKWVDDAILTNWVSTVGANINAVEDEIAKYVGVKYAVGLSAGTASLHLATKLAGEKLYGQARPYEGTLQGHKVFCSDMTFDATINPVAYEDGEAVFIDTEYDTWNMSPEALEKAFELYPDVKLVVVAHLYGTPGKMEEIKAICDKHGALIIEDAAESLGAKYKLNGEWVETGTLGDYNCISFNGNKIITGSAGGMFLTDSKEDADKVRKWSTQSRENAAWYQHEEIGFNYRMSNVIAGVIRGQMPYLQEHRLPPPERQHSRAGRAGTHPRETPADQTPEIQPALPSLLTAAGCTEPEECSRVIWQLSSGRNAGRSARSPGSRAPEAAEHSELLLPHTQLWPPPYRRNA